MLNNALMGDKLADQGWSVRKGYESVLFFEKRTISVTAGHFLFKL